MSGAQHPVHRRGQADRWWGEWAGRATGLGDHALRHPGLPVEGATAGTIPLEWTHVKGIEPNGTLLYLHGGGYFPGSIATHRRLTSEAGERPDRVIIAGDSAGGGFTFATLVAVRDAGDPLPDGGFGISPWTDLAGTASR